MTRPRSSHGFTVVELMMATTIFAIGMTGIIALQQVTVVANKHAKNLAIASHIAATWIDQLAVDATLWTRAGGGNRAWINPNATTDSAGAWLRPSYDTTRDIGARFDGLGNPLPNDNTTETAFCANIALTPLYRSAGNGVLRVEVRVFWLKDTGAADAVRTFCAAGSSPNDAAETITEEAAADPGLYHFVYETSAVRQQP